jgi:hypothetical protein
MRNCDNTLPTPCCAYLFANFLNQEMNFVLASARDRNGKPEARWIGVSAGLGMDSPVPLRLAWAGRINVNKESLVVNKLKLACGL